MRIAPLLLGVSLLTVACEAPGDAVDAQVRIRVRLQASDPHLVDVASVDLFLRRENVVVNERVLPGGTPTLSFPVEAVLTVPIGAGPLSVEAVARSTAGTAVGGGEAQISAVAGSIPVATIELLSERQRPVRVRMGAGVDPPDGGAPAAIDASAPDAAPPVPDAALADAEPSGPDAVDLPCTVRTRQVVADAVLSLDYSGDRPRDAASSLVRVARGFSHNHHHEFVGWLRFLLADVPDRAALREMKVSLVLAFRPQAPPPLGLIYSSNDGWDPARTSSEMAETVPRTATVSGPLGMPLSSRGDYPVDLSLYQRHWASDLADDAVSIGVVSVSPPEQPETWADFHGLDQPLLAPVLHLTTCE